MPDERIIKIDIMCHKDIILQQRIYPLRHFAEWGRSPHHLIGDTGETCDIVWDRLAGIDKRLIVAYYLLTIM